MKNFLQKALFLVAMSATLFACNTDEYSSDTTAQENAANTEVEGETARPVGAVYPEFSTLFTTLYAGRYDVSNAATTVTYNGIAYR